MIQRQQDTQSMRVGLNNTGQSFILHCTTQTAAATPRQIKQVVTSVMHGNMHGIPPVIAHFRRHLSRVSSLPCFWDSIRKNGTDLNGGLGFGETPSQVIEALADNGLKG